MDTLSPQKLASEITRLAAEIEIGDTPTRQEAVNGLFQTVQNQMGALIDEVKKEQDAATQKIHIQRLNQILDDLEMVWADLKPALEREFE